MMIPFASTLFDYFISSSLLIAVMKFLRI